MSLPAAAIYTGQVVHQRQRPRRHHLSYRVFSMLVDLDQLPGLDARLRLFSHNRFNLFSFHERDHGDGSAVRLVDQVRGLLDKAGLGLFGARIMLLGYPRMLGYVFNPLSVYYCLDDQERIGVVIYEVNNTFGQRKSYVLPVVHDAPEIFQRCAKTLSVSPFNTGRGRYSFHLRAPGDTIGVGVFLRDEAGALLRAHFVGERRDVNDVALLKLALHYPLMTLKIIAAIHFEALRLWLKGIPLKRREPAPDYSIDAPEVVASSPIVASSKHVP
jgi:DUF1365 family protein